MPKLAPRLRKPAVVASKELVARRDARGMRGVRIEMRGEP